MNLDRLVPLAVLCVALYAVLPGCQKTAPPPAAITSAVEALPVQDGYRVVSGSNLKDLRGDLLGRKIVFSGSIEYYSSAKGQVVLVSKDGKHRAEFWHSNAQYTVPADLTQQLKGGGLGEGDGITVYSTLVKFHEGRGGSSCYINPIDRWKRVRSHGVRGSLSDE